MTTLQTRPPTGRVPWPLILIEGGEKSGKSWAAAELSASPRVGRTLWLDLGEGAGDEYGAIAGARYQMIVHDGTWQTILGQIEAARDEARTAADTGEPPLVLIIDSMTLIWDMLKDWATNRARKTDSNQKKLRLDPNTEIVVATNFWNDANARHRKLMTILMTFPGIVIATARGKEVAEMGANGAPVVGKKTYRVEGHKDLAFDATVWLRVSREDEPLIVGCRSVHAGIQPGGDKARRVPGMTLDRLIFDVLRCNPGEAHPRDLQPLIAGDAGPDGEVALSNGGQPDLAGQLRDEILANTAPTREDFLGYYQRAKEAGFLDATIVDEHGDVAVMADWIIRRGQSVAQPAAPVRPTPPAEPAQAPATPAAPDGVTQGQHKAMHAHWGRLGLGGEDLRGSRLEETSRIIGRQITSSSELTRLEAETVITALESRPTPRKATPPTAPQAAAMTQPQRQQLFALMKERVGTDPAAGLAAVNTAIAPARVATSKELTEFQAAQVIGHLQGLPALAGVS